MTRRFPEPALQTVCRGKEHPDVHPSNVSREASDPTILPLNLPLSGINLRLVMGYHDDVNIGVGTLIRVLNAPDHEDAARRIDIAQLGRHSRQKFPLASFVLVHWFNLKGPRISGSPQHALVMT